MKSLANFFNPNRKLQATTKPTFKRLTLEEHEKPFTRTVQPRNLPRINLEGLINKMLLDAAEEGYEVPLAPERVKEERLQYVIHASEIHKCAAKMFFKLIRIPGGPHDPRTLRIFGNGHAVHRRVQGYLIEVAKRGIGGVSDYWENIKIHIAELGLFGELDFVFEFQGSDRYLIEIKSKKDDLFAAMKAPEPAWVNQGHAYMKDTGVNHSIYLVENKNSQHIKEPNVPWSDKTWAEIHKVCTEVNEAVEKEAIPSANTSDCYFCDYRQTICPAHKNKPSLVQIRGLAKIAKTERAKIL